jgi:hypothetical protein
VGLGRVIGELLQALFGGVVTVGYRELAYSLGLTFAGGLAVIFTGLLVGVIAFVRHEFGWFSVENEFSVASLDLETYIQA